MTSAARARIHCRSLVDRCLVDRRGTGRWPLGRCTRRSWVALGWMWVGHLWACTPTPEVPPPCGGAAERCVVPGHTSAAQCVESRCLGTDEACETGRDCFRVLEAGDVLPTWNRPQGGLGTRLNLRLEGFPADAAYEALHTQILGASQPDPADPARALACTPEACATPETCPCDVAQGFSCVTPLGDEPRCAELICHQVNRRFPLATDPFEASVVSEMPVRFENSWTLEALDGRSVELRMGVVLVGGDEESAHIPTLLDVGEFIKPSWWEE